MADMGETGPKNAPENYQREMLVSEQLGQIKDAAANKVSEFVDQANLNFSQAKNDPSNKASDEALKKDVDNTAQHAANSYNTAVDQVGKAVHTIEAKGKQAADQMDGQGSAESQQPTLLQSLGNTISQSVQSVKGAFVATRNEGTAGPTTTHQSDVSPQSRPISETIGQTAASVTDAVKNTFTPHATKPESQPGLEGPNTDMPQDVLRRAPKE